LDSYIDLAFEEATNFQKTYDAVALSRVIESAKTQVSMIRQEMNAGMAFIEGMQHFDKLLQSF
jgi:hypothetical protein